jgi:tetratricopeptide (TPR) repeat protein
MIAQSYAIALLAILATTSCASAAASGAGKQGRAAQLRRSPSVAELVERGRGFAAIGDFTRAEQYLSASLEAGADVHTALPMLVRVCIETGRYRVGIEHIRRYLREDSNDDRLHFLLGVLEAGVGNRDAALKELQAVLAQHPDDADGHYALGVLLRDGADDIVNADVHFRAYLRLAPEGAHTADARASLLQEP